MKITISHKEPHRLNAVYGWRAMLCGTGFHSYRRQACWTEGTSWWQHECKRCGHIKWFWVKGGRKMGKEMFPNRSLTPRNDGYECCEDLNPK